MDSCMNLYFKMQDLWDRWKYNRMYNLRYYKEANERLNHKCQKQIVEIYNLQGIQQKYELLMKGLKDIGEGLYRCRNGVAYIVSYKLEDKGDYGRKELNFVLHQVLPDFRAKATIAECRIYPHPLSPEILIFKLDFIFTELASRNRGLGREMIRYIEEIAEKFGASVIIGDVKQSKEEEYALRIKFYRNLGYDITGPSGNNQISKELKGFKS